RSWGRFGSATISLVDVLTGDRTKVADGVDDRFVRASPEGKFILYYTGGQFFTIDTARRTVTSITKAVKLTDGAADQTEFRFANVDPDAEAIDRSKPIYLSMAGRWSKKSGFARL